MRLLITGANGFVGSWLTRVGAEEGHEIVCGVREGSSGARVRPLEQKWPDRVGTVVLDVRDPDGLKRAFEISRPDVLIHAAAYGVDHRQRDPVQAAQINIMGTLYVAEAARAAGAARLVHLGTAYEYGSHPGPIGEDTVRRPAGIYGKTKAAASSLLRECAVNGGPATLIFWLFGLFGPGEGSHKLVPQVVQAARTKTPLNLTDGSQQRDYLFVGDVSRAIIAAATLPEGHFPAGEGFNLCSGRPVSVRAFATRIADHLGAREVLRFGPLPQRAEGNGAVVGNPAKWLQFCSGTGLESIHLRTSLEDVLQRWEHPAR